MALPTSGVMTFSLIAGEYGGTVPHQISEYYNADVADTNTLPDSGVITFGNFYGTSVAAGFSSTPGGSVTYLNSRTVSPDETSLDPATRRVYYNYNMATRALTIAGTPIFVNQNSTPITEASDGINVPYTLITLALYTNNEISVPGQATIARSSTEANIQKNIILVDQTATPIPYACNWYRVVFSTNTLSNYTQTMINRGNAGPVVWNGKKFIGGSTQLHGDIFASNGNDTLYNNPRSNPFCNWIQTPSGVTLFPPFDSTGFKTKYTLPSGTITVHGTPQFFMTANTKIPGIAFSGTPSGGYVMDNLIKTGATYNGGTKTPDPYQVLQGLCQLVKMNATTLVETLSTAYAAQGNQYASCNGGVLFGQTASHGYACGTCTSNLTNPQTDQTPRWDNFTWLHPNRASYELSFASETKSLFTLNASVGTSVTNQPLYCVGSIVDGTRIPCNDSTNIHAPAAPSYTGSQHPAYVHGTERQVGTITNKSQLFNFSSKTVSHTGSSPANRVMWSSACAWPSSVSL